MRWTLLAADPAIVERLAAECALTPALARLLVLRGIATDAAARHFLTPSLSDLHSPYLLRDLDVAVTRLRNAITNHEAILLYGDYDVDGTTAVTVLKTAIELCGGAAEFHVPHRIREGYGMQDNVIEQAAARGVRLIISVDTGIRALRESETAARLGMDLIVTDHHLPQGAVEDDESGEGLRYGYHEEAAPATAVQSSGIVSSPQDTLPTALAVLNPNRSDCNYPCKFLCGAAVAFKLAHALMLMMLGDERTERLLPSFLKIVAIATIADSVPLLDENRVFAKLGLRELRRPVSAGLKALLEVAAVDLGKPIKASDIGFRVAPRINAAGRMDEAGTVVELLTTRDVARAAEIATRLDQLNAIRQQEERRIMQEIDQRLSDDVALRESYCIVIEGEGWHRGVIGITASRVVEKYHRPAIVLSRHEGEAHGSGRSISAYHLLSGLESCAGIFKRFGGHAHAVGMVLPSDRVGELRAALDAHARARLTEADFIPELLVDAELPLSEITPELFATLSQMEPFGKENPEPVFVAYNVPLLEPVRVLKEAHIKLKLGTTGKRHISAVGWRMAERTAVLNLLAGDRVDVAFTLEENPHPDFGGLELRILDLRRTETHS